MKRAILAIAAVIALLGYGLGDLATSPTSPTRAPSSRPTPAPSSTPAPELQLGGPGDATVTLSPAVRAATDGLERGLRSSWGAVTLAAGVHKPAGQPRIPAHIPLAAATVPGCKTALVRNYSSRQGAPVLLGVIHWTAGPDTPNSWASIDGTLHWFDQLAAQASSNEITNSTGQCALAVPEASKAWTQAGFNRWAVSVEVTNPGRLPLVNAAGRARLVSLLVGWHLRWHIPLVRGAVKGCTITKPGIVAHRDLGACGGGHPDVGAYDLDGLIRAAAAAAAPWRATSHELELCRKLNWWRRRPAPRPHGHAWVNAIARKSELTRDGLICGNSGPVRRTGQGK